MARGAGHVSQIYFGHDENALYFRLDFASPPPGAVAIYFGEPDGVVIRTAPLLAPGNVAATLERVGKVPIAVTAAFGETLEVVVPLALLGVVSGGSLSFQVRLFAGDVAIEAHPPGSLIAFELLEADWALQQWVV